jgi:flagellar basal body P-ring formation protein FlgA
MIRSFSFAAALCLGAFGASPVLGQDASADILSRAVPAGTVLGPMDFEPGTVPTRTASQALSAEDASGMETRRPLRAGSIIRAMDVIAPRVVRRGETVGLVIKGRNFSVTGTGRALADAGKGDTVRVFVPATNQTLDGVAEAGGQVRILTH